MIYKHTVLDLASYVLLSHLYYYSKHMITYNSIYIYYYMNYCDRKQNRCGVLKSEVSVLGSLEAKKVVKN